MLAGELNKHLAIALVIAVGFAAVPLFVGERYLLGEVIVFFIWAMVAMNWNLLMGHVGTIQNFEDLMVERMVERGYEREFAERCFNQIKGFGEYGFPESHAASFAHLVYVSSWLKCHYPAVFACGLLNSQPMQKSARVLPVNWTVPRFAKRSVIFSSRDLKKVCARPSLISNG